MEKWKRLLAEAQAAAKKAQEIAAQVGDNAWTEDQRTEYQKHYDLAVAKKAEADTAKKAAEDRALLKELASSDDSAPDDDDQGGSTGTGLRFEDRQEKADRGTFGERFVKSGAYAAFRKEYPSGPSNGSPVNIGRVKVGSMHDWMAARKALTFPQAHTQPVRFPTIDMVDRDRLTLLDLIDRGNTDGDFEYVQVTGVTRNAKIVDEMTADSPAADLKPVSDMTTAIADAKVYTYADGYDVTNKLLANAPAFATYMNNELRYSLDNLIEEKLLNGTGTNGEPKGILTTTGVQQSTYTAAAAGADGLPVDATVRAFIRAVRIGILKVTRLPGGTVTGVLMSPEMDAALDLLEDADGRYLGQGPFGSGPGTLFGRPRITSERLVDTNALLGDWKQVALLDKDGLSVLVFNQHKDYAQRNLNYVRGELSAAQVIWKPNRLCLVKPTA